MHVKKVTLYQNDKGELFEKVSPSAALDVDNAVKAVEGEGETTKKFFVVPTVVPTVTAK